MNKQVKKKWVEALRSGEYEQGVCALKQDDFYCCLGVLTHLYNPKHNDLVDHEGWPSKDVCEWAEIPYYEKGMNSNITCLLADQNDHGKNFEDIADYIEANL